jgi:aryl-alcohol dehydrogenase-like predicted oxidoreductase
MQFRQFSDGPGVSEVGIGCWQMGGTEWGDVSEADALDALRASAEMGVTFIDTADIDTKGQAAPERPDNAAGEGAAGPRPMLKAAMSAIDQSMGGALVGVRKRFGASVESTAEAREALKHADCSSRQVIFNIFRQTPAFELFEQCQKQKVAVIVRLPLASGLLAGKYTPSTSFPEKHHRTYNRNGEKFNVGETFAGVGFEKGLELTERLRPLVPPGIPMAQMALRWCLDFPAVTTVIPGARNPAQAESNAAASDVPPLSKDLHARLRQFFLTDVKPHVRGPDEQRPVFVSAVLREAARARAGLNRPV